MLRVIVPTVYCRDPLDELFSSPWGFHYGRPTPRAVPCYSRRCGGSQMAYSTLAAFVEAMKAMEKSEQNCDNKCTNCSCKKTTDKAAAETHKSEPKESAKPSTSSEPADREQNNTPLTSEESEEAKPSEAVTVPMKRLDLSDSDHFQVSLNLKSFQPEDIEVTRVDNELKVHAKEQVERCGMIFHREIHRSYHLPEDVDVETLKSTLSTAGMLTIEAQRRPKTSEDARQQSENADDVVPEHIEDSNEDPTGEEAEVATEHQEESSSTSDETKDIKEEHTAEEEPDDEQAAGGQEE